MQVNQHMSYTVPSPFSSTFSLFFTERSGSASFNDINCHSMTTLHELRVNLKKNVNNKICQCSDQVIYNLVILMYACYVCVPKRANKDFPTLLCLLEGWKIVLSVEMLLNWLANQFVDYSSC